MSTKPIIFSTGNVKALLDGRKTMTRRVIKPQPTYWDDGECVYGKDSIVGPEFYNPICVDKDGEQYPGEEVYGIYSDDGEYGCKAPYKPGDVLWVRETWCNIGDWTCVDPSVGIPDGFIYKADWHARLEHPRWRPSIHMPREAARLFLRVKDARVEKLQDMPLFDVWDEGTPQMPGNLDSDGAVNQWDFRYLWDSLNAKRGYGWDKNPWVWVYSFERVDKPAGWPNGEGDLHHEAD